MPEYPFKNLAEVINGVFSSYNSNQFRDFRADIIRFHEVIVEGLIVCDKSKKLNNDERVDEIIEILTLIPNDKISSVETKKWISGLHQGVMPGFLNFVNNNYVFFEKSFSFLPDDKNKKITIYRIGNEFYYQCDYQIRTLLSDGSWFRLNNYCLEEITATTSDSIFENAPIICNVRAIVSIDLTALPTKQPIVSASLKVTSFHDQLFYTGPAECAEVNKLENIKIKKYEKLIYNLNAFSLHEKRIEEYFTRSKSKINSLIDVFVNEKEIKVLTKEELLINIISFYDHVLSFRAVKEYRKKINEKIFSLSSSEPFKEKILDSLNKYKNIDTDQRDRLAESGKRLIKYLFFGYFTGLRQKVFVEYLSRIHNDKSLSVLYAVFYDNFSNGVLALKHMLDENPAFFSENIEQECDFITLKIRDSVVEIENSLQEVLAEKHVPIPDCYKKLKIATADDLYFKISILIKQDLEKIKNYYLSEKGQQIIKQGTELFESIFELMYESCEGVVRKVFQNKYEFSELVSMTNLEMHNIFKKIDNKKFVILWKMFFQDDLKNIICSASFLLRNPEKFFLVSFRENRTPFFKSDDFLENQEFHKRLVHLNKICNQSRIVGEIIEGEGDESFFDAFWQGLEDLGATSLIKIPKEFEKKPSIFLERLANNDLENLPARIDFLSKGKILCHKISSIKLHIIEIETKRKDNITFKHILITGSGYRVVQEEEAESLYQNCDKCIHIVTMMKYDSKRFSPLIKNPGDIFISRVSESVLNVINGIQSSLNSAAKYKKLFFYGYSSDHKVDISEQIDPVFMKYLCDLINSKDRAGPLSCLFEFMKFYEEDICKKIKRNSCTEVESKTDHVTLTRKTNSVCISNAEKSMITQGLLYDSLEYPSFYGKRKEKSRRNSENIYSSHLPHFKEDEVISATNTKVEPGNPKEVMVFIDITLPPKKNRMVFSLRNKTEALSVLWARNPLVEGFKALGIHYSIDQFLKLYPSLRNTIATWLFFTDIVGGTIGLFVGRNLVLNQNEPMSRFTRIWVANNNGLIVLIFATGSAIKIYSKIHPEDDIITNEKFYSQLMPLPIFFSIFYVLWNSISENNKKKFFWPRINLIFEIFFEFGLYSQYFESFFKNILETPAKTGYIILPYLSAVLVGIFKIISSKHQQKIDTTMTYIMASSLACFLIKDLEKQCSSNDTLTLTVAYIRIAFWLCSLSYSFVFILKNRLRFVEEYNGTPKVIYQKRELNDCDSFIGETYVSHETFKNKFHKLENHDDHSNVDDNNNDESNHSLIEGLKGIKKTILERSSKDSAKSSLIHPDDTEPVLFSYNSFVDTRKKHTKASEKHNESLVLR